MSDTCRCQMEVCLAGVRFHAFHGMLPQEVKVGNEFEVDVHVRYGIDESEVSDNLSGSLCYAALYELVSEHMKLPSGTLEHLSCRIGRDVFSRWPHVGYVEVGVVKLAPPIPGFQGVAKVIWRCDKGLSAGN